MIGNLRITLYKLFLIFCLITIFSSITGCAPFIDDTQEVVFNLDDQYYIFDSTTILDELNRGNSDVFIPLETTPKPRSSPPSVTVPWAQADYLRVAQAIQKSILREPIGSLNLYYATFIMDCVDTNKGTFSKVDYVFYRIIQKEDVETRLQYHIIIIPSENLINTTKSEFVPNNSVITPTDLGHYQITAENVLQIAEENGGAKKRSELNNSCMVYGNINALDGWTVIYQTRNEYRWKPIYKITINPQTGSYKVTMPK